MGYYTYFTLNVYGPEEDQKAMVEEAKKLVGEPEDEMWNEGIKQLVMEKYIDAKWYDFREDFSKFAKRFPSLLFVVDGDGEESDDIWQLRIKGDESEYREMTMPPLENKNLAIPYEF